MEATSVPQEVTAVLERSRELGFLGPQPIARQVEHALGFWRAIVASGFTPTRAVLDLGSGGGLPGLVLQGVMGALPMTLLDGSVRRCAFLEEAIEELNIAERVSVACGRAEELGHVETARSSFDLVVARSFGPPAAVAECAAPFLAIGGRLLVSEPPEGVTEDRWPPEGVAALGFGPVREISVGARFALLELLEPCEERFPRRTGVPSKRPLF